MKKVHFTIMAFLGIVVLACAAEVPESKVPSVVKNALMTKYPDATDIEWEYKRQLYEVEFEVANTDYEAWIDSTGTLLKVEKDIAANEVPALVRKKIEEQFKNQTIDDAEEIIVQGKTYYRVELEGGLGDHKVVYDDKGNPQNSGVLYTYN